MSKIATASVAEDEIEEPTRPATRHCRILIVDDHCIVREGLSLLIETVPGLKVIGCVATGREAVDATLRLRPDVVIMDLVLPELNGIEATERIIHDLPQTRIIALSSCHTYEHLGRMLRAGASGYVLKAAGGTELLRAIEEVTAGKQYISAAIRACMGNDVAQHTVSTNPIECLSSRERQVLQLIVAGLTSVEIAKRLSLSSKTIETYRSRMMFKLSVANRSELVQAAQRFELPEA